MNRIVKNRHPRFEDFFDVGALPQCGDVAVNQVFFDDRAAVARAALSERLADRAIHLRQRRPAVPRFELDAVVIRGIVAGGDHDAAEKPAVRHGERNCLRWRRRIREHDVVPGGFQCFGSGNGEFARQETAIVADDQRVPIDVARGIEFASRDADGIAHTTDVLECEGVGNDGTPAIGAKRDLGHQETLLTKDAA